MSEAELEWQNAISVERSEGEGNRQPLVPVSRRVRRQTTGYERVVFIPDLHCPYHDEDVVRQVRRMVKDYAPDRIVFLGDVIDAYPISRFSKDPERKESLQDEFDSGHRVLREFREDNPSAEIDLTPGNHEKRLDSFLWTQAPALASLRCMRLGELLRLSEVEVALHDYSGFKLRENYRCTHGTYVRKHAGHTAKAEYEHWGINGASGHTHRAGTHVVTNDSGTGRWDEFGHLCDVSKADYVTSPNWQQSFGIGEFERGGNRFQVELIHIPRRRLVYHGRDYSEA